MLLPLPLSLCESILPRCQVSIAGEDRSVGNRIFMPAISTLVQQRTANIVKLDALPRIEAPELLKKDTVQSHKLEQPNAAFAWKGLVDEEGRATNITSTMNNASPASPTTLNLTSLCKEYSRSLGSAFIRNRIIVSCRVEKSSAIRSDTAISPPQS